MSKRRIAPHDEVGRPSNCSNLHEPDDAGPDQIVKIPPKPGVTPVARDSVRRMISTTEIAAWSTWLLAAGLPETTIGLRTYHVRRVMSELDTDPWSLTTTDLVEWLAAKDWAPNTRRSYRASLRGFYRWAQATGRRLDDPAALIPTVPVPRAVSRPTPEVVYLQALVDATPRVRRMIQLAAQCGLRRGEIARARREDIERDVLGEWSLRVRGKGGHVRMVPLPTDFARELLALPPGWLFPSTSTRGGIAGTHLTPAHVGKLVAAVLLDNWTCHTLRHRCGTVAYMSTKDIRAVQELLGHAKLETTMIYTLIGHDAVRRAVAAASRPAA